MTEFDANGNIKITPEMEARADRIQLRPLTDETITTVEQISKEMGEDPALIAQQRELMERMKYSMPITDAEIDIAKQFGRKG